jgi:hypothetical protein
MRCRPGVSGTRAVLYQRPEALVQLRCRMIPIVAATSGNASPAGLLPHTAPSLSVTVITRSTRARDGTLRGKKVFAGSWNAWEKTRLPARAIERFPLCFFGRSREYSIDHFVPAKTGIVRRERATMIPKVRRIHNSSCQEASVSRSQVRMHPSGRDRSPFALRRL